MKNKPVYIDLFSGCGGLSLGLKRVGFDLALAVEKSPMAAETYYHNFIKRIEDKSEWQDFSSDENSIMSQAENKLVIKEIKEVLINNELMLRLKSQ
ncbi:MAG TPA: DNA cytosine methyltransferase, partial [Trueperaceae bacterium]|nr:DNA cytosine methyltransferase [Trueperaceae bacterium]